MDIRTLRYFLVTAQERNFTKAANKLCMAQPPLSRQIKLLEEELGVEFQDDELLKITTVQDLLDLIDTKK